MRDRVVIVTLGVALIAVVILSIALLKGPSIQTTSGPSSISGSEFRCIVGLSTATTIQAVGGACVAPGANVSLYITDVVSIASAAGSTADSYNTLKYGTGGTCGTGTTSFYGFLSNATVETFSDHFVTPIKVPANNELCWINTTAGNKAWLITGFRGPS